MDVWGARHPRSAPRDRGIGDDGGFVGMDQGASVDSSDGAQARSFGARLTRDLLAAAIIVVAAVVLGLVQNAVSADPLPLIRQSTPTVAAVTTPQQVKREAAAGAVLIDSRSEEEYFAGHIKGALNLSYADREQLAEQFVRTVPGASRLIVYCDIGCDSSSRLASWLGAKGWTDIAVFEGGVSAWRDAGLPVSTGAQP